MSWLEVPDVIVACTPAAVSGLDNCQVVVSIVEHNSAMHTMRNLCPAEQILGSEPSGTSLVVVSGGWLFAEAGKKTEI